jgi:hypothetical protein
VQTPFTIPRIIHFIWAGGQKLLPSDSAKIILQWARNNPRFHIYLWVDYRTAPPDIHLERLYQEQFIHLAEVTSLDPALVRQNLRIKDIEAEQVVDECSRYEISRLRPNYGASSDLLRYRILHQFGGAYFDSDVSPGQINLESISEQQAGHCLYVDDNSQNSGRIGNDAFICTQYNPIMKAIYDRAIANYFIPPAVERREPLEEKGAEQEELLWYNEAQIITYYFDEEPSVGTESYTVLATIERTGPACVRSVLEEYKLLPSSEGTPLIRMDRLTAPMPNTRNWIGKKLSTMLAERQILEIVQDNMRFEIIHFKLLRLDDHIRNLIELFPHKTDEMIRYVLSKAEELLANKQYKRELVSIQLTYQFPDSIQFCERLYLLSKVFALPTFARMTGNSSSYLAIVPAKLCEPFMLKFLEGTKLNPDEMIAFCNGCTKFLEHVCRESELLLHHIDLISVAQQDGMLKYLQHIQKELGALLEQKILQVPHIAQLLPEILRDTMNQHCRQLTELIAGINASKAPEPPEATNSCCKPRCSAM